MWNEIHMNFLSAGLFWFSLSCVLWDTVESPRSSNTFLNIARTLNFFNIFFSYHFLLITYLFVCLFPPPPLLHPVYGKPDILVLLMRYSLG